MRFIFVKIAFYFCRQSLFILWLIHTNKIILSMTISYTLYALNLKRDITGDREVCILIYGSDDRGVIELCSYTLPPGWVVCCSTMRWTSKLWRNILCCLLLILSKLRGEANSLTVITVFARGLGDYWWVPVWQSDPTAKHCTYFSVPEIKSSLDANIICFFKDQCLSVSCLSESARHIHTCCICSHAHSSSWWVHPIGQARVF